MIKRKFGMRTLNISQGRYGSYSHKYLNAYDLTGEDSGIDKFTAYYPFIVIGVHKFNHLNNSGFANTVHFYDDENDITIAMTHMDDVSKFEVGKRVRLNEIMYLEGTTGRATGNHIHMEIGKGKQPNKYFIKSRNLWGLDNTISIEDYFYLDETHIIKNSKGYNFEIRYSGAIKEDEIQEQKGVDNMEHLSGYQELNERGLEILLYAQKNGQKLGMISAAKNNSEYKSLKTLDKIDDDRVHFAKINANYFQMGGTENGQHYGVEITPQVDLVPHQKEWLALWIVKGEKVIRFDNSTNFNLSKNDVEFACSPYAVFYHYGKDCDYVSSACGNKKSVKNTQTFLIQLNETKDYQIILGVVKNKCYPKEIVEWAKAKFGNDLLHLSLYDSGGSSQLIVNGEKKLFTSRPIANALTLYKDKPSTLTNESDRPSTDTVQTEKPAEDTQNEEIKALQEENQALKEMLEKIKEIIGGK